MAFFNQQMTSGALISACGKYRYKLWRVWDLGKPAMVWVMLNPSKANATENDATIRWIMGYAKALGYGGVLVVNLFAFRATVPEDMKKAPGPIGPENDRHIVDAIAETRANGGTVVLAWGNHGSFMDRDRAVFALVRKSIHRYSLPEAKCLGVTVQQQPMHPVRLSRNLGLKAYEGRK